MILGLLTGQRAALRGGNSLYCRQVGNEIAWGGEPGRRGPEGQQRSLNRAGGRRRREVRGLHTSKWLLELH